MQFLASTRTTSLRLSKGSCQYTRISSLENHRCLRKHCAVTHDRLFSISVQRRQVLKTTSLSLLSSWLPFARMSAKAEFQLPGERWWSPETVAVVTGGEQQRWKSILITVHNPGIRYIFAFQHFSNITCLCSQQRYWLWYSKTAGCSRSANSGSCP